MAKYRLEELCEIITDGTHQTPDYCDELEGVKFLSSKDVTDRVINWDNVKYIPYSLHEDLYKRLRPKKNDILLAKNGTTGVAALVDRDEIFDIYVSLALLRPQKSILPKYLLYAVNSNSARRQFNAGLKGIGVPNLHLSVIRKTEVSIAPREEQESICNILDCVSSVIELRKKELVQLDELIKARFVEMFGTPLLNDRGWKVIKAGECCLVITDGSHFSPQGQEDGYPMLSVKDMRNDGFHYESCKRVSEEDYQILKKQGCIPQKNDVLISKDGSYFYYGFVLPEYKEQAILSSIAMLRPDINQVNPYFLCNYMLSERIVGLVSENYVTGAALKRVILKGIKQIPVMLPPIELQNEFESFVKQVDKSKIVVQKSMDEAQLLFDSLMQKYFG